MTRSILISFVMLVAFASFAFAQTDAVSLGHSGMTLSEHCATCHRFEESYDLHTKHSELLRLKCVDCHPKIPITVTKSGDVHDPAFFKVHIESTGESETEKACKKCHWKKPRRQLRAVLGKWDQTIYWMRE